jgi:HK97 family phage major capsid protein
MLRELLERRAALAGELRALNDKPAGDNGDLSQEQRGRWDALKGELDTLEQRISRQATLDDADRRMAGQPIAGTVDRDFERAFAGVGLLDAIRAQTGATDERAGRARELSQELARRSGRSPQGLFWDMRLGRPEQRTLTTTTPADGPGGTLIPTDYRAQDFIDRLRSATVVRRLGARVISNAVGNIAIPRLTGSVTAGWVAENQPFPMSDPKFGSLTMTPKHMGVITELSRNMLQQTSPDAEALVQDDQARVLAEGLDLAALAGTGAGNQPRGILNQPGLRTVAGPLNYLTAADMIAAADDANALGSMAFVGNAGIRRAIAGLLDAAGNPLGAAVVLQNTPSAFTNLMPNGTLLFGDFSQLIVAFWSELDVLVNPFAEGPYSRGNVMIRTALTADIAVRHIESFAVMTDATAVGA